MAVSAARWAAFQVLHRVESAEAFAAHLLHSRLALDERDLGLAEELALGVLRWQGELDRLIGEAAGRPLESLDREVRLALRLGAYQLRRLDRIPARAAVSESVEIVKRARKASAAGLVNAVMRKLAARETPPGPPRPEWAVPSWLLDRWRQAYGDAVAAKIALSTLETPPTYLRLNARFDTEETLRRLAGEGVRTAPTELPFCRRVLSGKPASTECFRQGRVRIQDLGSQRIAPLLGPDAPQRFLDVCAAPGGKTFQALEQWRDGPRGAIAGDLYHHRLVTMRRLSTLPVALITLDAAASLPFSTSFDRILVRAVHRHRDAGSQSRNQVEAPA